MPTESLLQGYRAAEIIPARPTSSCWQVISVTALCKNLEDVCGGNIVRRLRQQQPYISKITSAEIIKLCTKFPLEDAEALCERWPYRYSEGGANRIASILCSPHQQGGRELGQHRDDCTVMRDIQCRAFSSQHAIRK